MNNEFNTQNTIVITIGATIAALAALGLTVYLSALSIGLNEQVFEVPKDFLLQCIG